MVFIVICLEQGQESAEDRRSLLFAHCVEKFGCLTNLQLVAQEQFLQMSPPPLSRMK